MDEMQRLQQRVTALEQQVARLTSRVWELKLAQGMPPQAVEPDGPESLATVVDAVPAPEVQAPAPAEPVAAEPPTVAPARWETARPEPAVPSVPALVPDEAERTVVGVWFSRVGVVLVILAAIFGVKWASDNGYIGPGTWISLGYLSALGALGGGVLTQRRGYRAWALAVTGLGIGLGYVSTFAAFQVFGLFSHGLAFAVMVLLALLSAGLSLHHDAVPIAWLGTLGGFLTPFLLDNGQGSTAALFTYLALLDLGVLLLASRRKWRSLDLLGLVGTWVIFLMTWVLTAHPVHFGLFFGFATLFFVIFAVVPVLYNLVQRAPAAGADLTLILVGGLLYFAVGLGLLSNAPGLDGVRGAFALAVAVLYLLQAVVARRRSPADRFLQIALLGVGLLFLTLAVPVQLHGHWMVLAWAVEATLLSALGLRFGMAELTTGGLGVLAVALFITWGQTFDEALPSLSYGATTVALWSFAVLYQRLPVRWLGERQPGWVQGFYVAANAWTVLWGSLELWPRDYSLLADQVPSRQALLIMAGWALYALPLLWISLRRRLLALAALGLGLLGLGAVVTLGLGVNVVAGDERGSLYFSLAFLATAVTLWYATWLYNRRDAGWPADLQRRARVGFALSANSWTLLWWTLEIVRYFGSSSLWEQHQFARGFSISVLWALYGLVLLVLGFIRRARPARLMGIGALGLTLGKVGLSDIWNLAGGWRVLGLFATGGVLLTASYLYFRYKDRLMEDRTAQLSPEA